MLAVKNLTRVFGDLVAVDDVSFDVPDGATVGFIGGNGAGKTTTMRMMMGLLEPTSGEVFWNDKPITREVRSRIGYMPEERGLYPKQEITSQLTYIGQLKGMKRAEARAQAVDLLTRFGLGERTKEKLEKLSLGNQQRVQIAASLMAQPAALILDEPFSGLDPKAVDEMAELLGEHTGRHIPVLFSSHQLDLVERLCDYLVILASGRVVAAGTADQLRDHGTTRHRLVTDHDLSWIRDIPGIRVDSVDGSVAVLELDDTQAANRILSQALERGAVHEFAIIRPSLNEIYREVTNQ